MAERTPTEQTADVVGTFADAGRQVVTLATDRTQEGLRQSVSAYESALRGLGGRGADGNDAGRGLTQAVVDEMIGFTGASLEHTARFAHAFWGARTLADLVAAQMRWGCALFEEGLGRSTRIATIGMRRAARSVTVADDRLRRPAA